MNQPTTAYADLPGIRLYYEIHGQGDPIVLIHGGLTTIGEMQPWVQTLAATRRVIAVEMQGHGHTADTDRPLSFSTFGDDIAALPMPVLLVFADNDSVPQREVAEFFALLGGGLKEPGWLNTKLSTSRLAVVPGYSHYNLSTARTVRGT